MFFIVVNSLIDIGFQLSHVCSANLVLSACGVSDSCIGGGEEISIRSADVGVDNSGCLDSYQS